MARAAGPRRRFDLLVSGLESEFACGCVVDRHVQDASLNAGVDISAEETATGDALVFCVSNLGELATVAFTDPGVWTESEFEARLAAADADRVSGALDELGHRVVPEGPLWEDYDGPSPRRDGPSRGSTWWTRLFDYL